MLEPPSLDDDIIVTALHDAYAIPVTSVAFLPIGYDANAWIYRVDCADDQRHFLKVRQGPLYPASFTVPAHLNELGIKQVVAPSRTKAGSLWTSAGHFTLILYPFIDGGTGADVGMSGDHWQEFGSTLQRVHSTALPPNLLAQVRKESFFPAWAEMIVGLQTKIARGDYSGPHAEALAAFWLTRQSEIEEILGTTLELGRLLRAQRLQTVLCHADAHIHNVLIDKQRRFHIVDWDGLIMAPKERDLMFMLSAGTEEDPGNAGALRFRQGYGEVNVNPTALAYYRYEWVVQEIGDFGERVFLPKDTGDITQKESVEGFIELFDPGDVVEEAYTAYTHPNIQKRSTI